ncbi:hypothetical protein COCOBI_06-3740 [Coccomyxa sp. Obi]|nr:hypothetical protein COCOBI_06-3740 [Coccomyxa sp. Obi]
MRCPCCEAFVSEAAFHKKDLLTTFFVGEGVLGWPKAHKALKLADDPAQGRRMLDEALDLRGNFYFGAVGPCCVGCAAWHRVFNLLPRWALTAACLSLVGTYTPWAFGQSLANLRSWGGKLQAMAEVFGLYFGTSCLLVQLHSMAAALSFMTKYAGRIPFPARITVPDRRWMQFIVEILAGSPASSP